MSQQAANSVQNHKEVAMEFLRLAASGNVREAYRSYIGPEFRLHNPFFRGDAKSLMVAMEENAAQNQNKILEIQRALQDGDLVAIHSRIKQKPDDLGVPLVHIFRFQGNLITEIWDIGQTIPEKSPNDYGMF